MLTELSKELTKKQVNFIKKDCEDPWLYRIGGQNYEGN